MKKTLSIIMALCMILSVCFFSVSAAEAKVGAVAANYVPEGTAITDAAGFAAMTADGKYYLANDITLSASYAEAFKGTFDGNGKTVTVAAPMFTAIDGATIKNLTVAGAIDGAAANTAAVAVTAANAVTFANVVSKVVITNAKGAASLLAVADATASVTVTACVNEGSISGTGTVGGLIGLINNNVNTVTACENRGELLSTGGQCGGIVSSMGVKDGVAPNDMVTITDCVNYANITGDKAQSGGILAFLCGGVEIKNCINYGKIVNTNNKAGGIFGTSIQTTKNVCAISIENCINYGEVCSSKVVAGIAARLGRAVQVEGMNYSINNCVNYGKITAYTDIAYTGVTLYMGGITGYAYGGSLTPANAVTNCVNFGDIEADTSHLDASSSLYVGGIIAYVNAVNYVCKNNINAGNMSYTGTLAPTGIGRIVYNVKLDAAAAEANNYSVDALAGVAFADNYTAVVTADQLASGEVAALINEAAGETIYYQAIGTDKAPVPFAAEDGSNTVLKNADGTYSNPVVEVPEETKPADPVPTGDSALIFAVVALISVFGVATIAKRREN